MLRQLWSRFVYWNWFGFSLYAVTAIGIGGSGSQLSSVPAGERRIDCWEGWGERQIGDLILKCDWNGQLSLSQVFGSPSTPILENPEHQTRWYFKYFLGKCKQRRLFNWCDDLLLNAWSSVRSTPKLCGRGCGEAALFPVHRVPGLGYQMYAFMQGDSVPETGQFVYV